MTMTEEDQIFDGDGSGSLAEYFGGEGRGVLLYCLYHPEKRWTANSVESMQGKISRNRHLAFKGTFVAGEFVRGYPYQDSRFPEYPVFECHCPVSALREVGSQKRY